MPLITFAAPVSQSSVDALTAAIGNLSADEAAIAALQAALAGVTGTNTAQDQAIAALQALPSPTYQKLLAGGPYTVVQLLALPTAGLPTGAILTVSNLGGCGGDNLPGLGLVWWTGAEWRRVSLGVQATMDPAATINLDYWTSPMRIKLTGTAVVSTRFVITNARLGAKYALYKPGLITGVAALVNLQGNTSATDLTLAGSGLGLLEVTAANTLTAVST